MQKINDNIYFFHDNQLKKGKLVALEEDYLKQGIFEFYILDLAGVEYKVLKAFCFTSRAEIFEYISEVYSFL